MADVTNLPEVPPENGLKVGLTSEEVRTPVELLPMATRARLSRVSHRAGEARRCPGEPPPLLVVLGHGEDAVVNRGRPVLSPPPTEVRAIERGRVVEDEVSAAVQLQQSWEAGVSAGREVRDEVDRHRVGIDLPEGATLRRVPVGKLVDRGPRERREPVPVE